MIGRREFIVRRRTLPDVADGRHAARHSPSSRPAALPPKTRDSAVSTARNRPMSPKMPARSLASSNFFPAEFLPSNRDWFECRQRPVRVLNAWAPSSALCQLNLIRPDKSPVVARPRQAAVDMAARKGGLRAAFSVQSAAQPLGAGWLVDPDHRACEETAHGMLLPPGHFHDGRDRRALRAAQQCDHVGLLGAGAHDGWPDA
jgi:hypothetical protein